ncbi:hypothetical protein ACX3VG_22250, partial [Escherichia coli]
MAQVAIITASDSGIGKECALLLAQQGFDIGITLSLIHISEPTRLD